MVTLICFVESELDWSLRWLNMPKYQWVFNLEVRAYGSYALKFTSINKILCHATKKLTEDTKLQAAFYLKEWSKDQFALPFRLQELLILAGSLVDGRWLLDKSFFHLISRCCINWLFLIKLGTLSDLHIYIKWLFDLRILYWSLRTAFCFHMFIAPK